MRKTIKKWIKAIFRKWPKLKKPVTKLYRLTREDNSSNSGKSNKAMQGTDSPANLHAKEALQEKVQDDIYSGKAAYTGYGMDYISSLFFPKEERAIELKKVFYRHCNYYLDLDHPKTFNQKIQWLKLNYYDPRMGRCVDKCEFKRYITEQLGEGYTVPLYGEWESENQIDFDLLPDQFVLKSNVQSDGRHIIVVKNKAELDIDRLKTVMSSWLLKRNNLCSSYCIAYRHVRPKILAEEYINDLDNDALIDYKIMCFNGKAELLFTVLDRDSNMSVNFYDLDWNLLPCRRKYPNSNYPVKPPKNLDKMIEIANQLAEPFPFVRVDFYETADGSKLYVGELTFYPGGGYESFEPMEWDYKLGEMLKLPEANV